MIINFYTKDPAVSPPRIINFPDSGKVRPGPEDDRIRVLDVAPAAGAKPRGNFLYHPEEPQFDACEVFGVLRMELDLYKKILGRKIPFAFPGKVTLLPHDGPGINAFYNRQDRAVHFLEAYDPADFKNFPQIPNGDLRMAQCLDVGAHEDGHLDLDGLKPEYLNLELETQAFHEAWGDIAAMIMALQFNEVIARMIEETAGDLRKSNVVTRLGKEAGIAIQALKPNPDPRHYFLRDATFTLQNDWQYVPCERLAEWNPKDETRLGAEPHNFSRFFSGLWYEIFVNLYENDPQKTSNPQAAVRSARDAAAGLIVRAAADFAPETSGSYPDIARAMLQADHADYGGAHEETLERIFARRKLLPSAEFHWRALPKLMINSGGLTPRKAENFLAKHRSGLGLPAGMIFKAAADFPAGESRYMYKNQNGETFLVFHSAQKGTLHLPEHPSLHGAEYEAKGSVKLGFDKEGRLFHTASDFILPRKHERIHGSLRRCHENGYVAAGPSSFKNESRKIPYFAFTEWENGRKTVKRVPIFA